MDATTEYLSDYVCKLTYEALSPETIHQVKRPPHTPSCRSACRHPSRGAWRLECTGILRHASFVQRRKRLWIWRPSRIRVLFAISTVTMPTRHGQRAIRAT